MGQALINAPSTNHAPVAVSDNVVVLANSTYNVFNVLANDSDPEGDALRILSVSGAHIGFAQSINSGKSISYVPQPGVNGSDYFSYTISDGNGGTASATVNVTIYATDAPHVAITNLHNNDILTAGVATNILTFLTPSDFVGKVEFFLHDIKLGEDTNAPYGITWLPVEDPCGCGITARATDIYGQIATSEPVYVKVNPPDNDALPVARIANLSNSVVQIPGHTLTAVAIIREGLFELRGDATDTDSTNVSYKIRIFSPAGELIRDITPLPQDSFGFHAGAVTNGILGTNDFTLLRNGLYDLELLVRGGYRETNATVRFSLDSEMKVGHFAFSEQDLVIPVNGFPLTVTRTYNSLDPNQRDFGFSWTYALNDMEMEIDEVREQTESLFDDVESGEWEPSGQFFSLRTGGSRNVTLTLPNGRRTTFYHYLEPSDCQSAEQIQLCATPKWAAAPGVTETLGLIDDVKLAVLPGNLEWWTDDGSTLPENYDLRGFVLTNLDGTEYRLEREDLDEHFFVGEKAGGNYAHSYGKGRLTQIKQRSGDRIYLNANRVDPDGKTRFSITHTDASGNQTRSVVCERDQEGRIVAISDPSGLDGSGLPNGPPVLKYEYAGGNLTKVYRLQDKSNPSLPVYSTTTYEYTNASFPHFITGIVDPRGVTGVRTEYAADGRVKSTTDASGKTITFTHDIYGKTETVVDRLGNTNVFRYDARGNVTNSIDALGFTNSYAYDSTNRLTSELDALGNPRFYTYDLQGNRLQLVDALGRTNRFGYDPSGNLVIQIDPLGNVT